MTVTRNWIVPKRVLLLYLFFLFALLVQFAYISLSPKVYGDDLKQIAANRTTVSTDLIANRGTIYDSEENILATTVTSYTLIAYLSPSKTTNINNPHHVVNKEMTAQKLSEVLDAPYDYILERLNQNLYQVEFGIYGSKLTELKKIEIENLDLPGIDFIESTKRFYPNGQFASYIIGYAREYPRINLKLKEDFDLKDYYSSYYSRYKDVKLTIYNEDIVADNGATIKAIKVGSTFYQLSVAETGAPLVRGILNVIKNDVSTRTDIVTEGELGIESKFNSELRGTNGSLTYQRDPSGYRIPDTPEERVEPIDGKDVYLTINSNIQRFLETAVKEEVKDWGSEWMIMAVMDAKTGEILGSATSPSFDPNSLSSDMSYQNPLVSYGYEPGSVMKIYTYLCAADTGNYDGEKKYRSGSIKIGDTKVNDWNKNGWGDISYNLGFTYSSNVGAIHVARDYLTPSKLKACLKSYGFGAKTGIELSQELTGTVNFNENVDVDWLSVSFGQGLTTTAIQQLQALSIIANDGHIVKPHIIKKVVDRNTGEVTETKTEVTDRVASSEAVATVKQLMYDNVNFKHATGRYYNIKNFHVIGKTGTAQIAENGKYLTGNGNYIVSFAGMFPFEDPEIIIYTAIKKPRTYLSYVTYPYVVDVLKNVAKYRNMFTDTDEDVKLQKYSLASYTSSNTISVKNELEKDGLKVILIGDGDKVIDQYPKATATVLTGDKVFLLTNGENNLMPNMKNWARSEVIKYAEMANIPLTINGYGYVVSQSIKSGEVVDGELVVNLENKTHKTTTDNKK